MGGSGIARQGHLRDITNGFVLEIAAGAALRMRGF